MKIKVLRGTVVDGKKYQAGKVVDASDKAARYLVTVGKAEPAKEKAPAPVTQKDSDVSQPAPKKRGRPKANPEAENVTDA